MAVHASAEPTAVEASGTITLTTSADLSAAKSIVSSGKAVPGKTITYEVAANNHGPSSANEVKLVDHLQSGLTYKSSTPTGCGVSAGVVTCDAGTVEAGHSASFQIEVELAPALTGVISNTVRAESTTPDPEPANNEATAKVTASPQAELELEKESLTPEVHDGEHARFSLTATNSGPSEVSEVKITDVLPAGLSYLSATGTGAICKAKGQEVTCTFATPLAVHGHVSVELVTQTSGPGIRVNTATVSSAAEDLEPANNTATAEVKVLPSADLALLKTASAPFVRANGEVTYTLTVENKGPDAASKVLVGDELPAGEKLLTSSTGCTQTGQDVSCAVGGAELASGQTRAVELTVRMEVSLAEHSVLNTANVTSETFDPNLANNTAHAEVQVETAADLQLTKAAAPTSVEIGGEVTYTLIATDAGPDTVKGATVTDQLPAGETYVSNDAGCTEVGQLVSCSLGELLDGATRTIHIVVRIGPALAEHTVENTAEASSETPDPDEANNKAEAEITVAPAADLELTKKVAIEGEGATLALPGKATYTLVVANAGPDTASEVLVSDTLPAGESYLASDAGCSVAGQSVSCALGELADGEARTIHLTVSVGVSLGERTVTNTATVTSATYDPNMANNTASASMQTGPAADVAIEKTGPASVVSGASIAWTLKLTDRGPSTAHQVVVEDPLPSGVTLTHAAATQGACQSTGSVLRCELGTLADGAGAEVTVTGTVTATSGTLRNTATVHALRARPRTRQQLLERHDHRVAGVGHASRRQQRARGARDPPQARGQEDRQAGRRDRLPPDRARRLERGRQKSAGLRRAAVADHGCRPRRRPSGIHPHLLRARDARPGRFAHVQDHAARRLQRPPVDPQSGERERGQLQHGPRPRQHGCEGERRSAPRKRCHGLAGARAGSVAMSLSRPRRPRSWWAAPRPARLPLRAPYSARTLRGRCAHPGRTAPGWPR